jgi:hypothetical protein
VLPARCLTDAISGPPESAGGVAPAATLGEALELALAGGRSRHQAA